MNLQNSCILLGGKLKRSVSRGFWPKFILFKPAWAHDKQAKVYIFKLGSISSRYLIIKCKLSDSTAFMTPRTQGWEFALLFICSLLFCSKSLRLKSNCQQFAQVAHYKRATLSKLLSSLVKKSNREQFAQVPQDKRATMSKRANSQPCVLGVMKYLDEIKPNSKICTFACLSGAQNGRII